MQLLGVRLPPAGAVVAAIISSSSSRWYSMVMYITSLLVGAYLFAAACAVYLLALRNPVVITRPVSVDQVVSTVVYFMRLYFLPVSCCFQCYGNTAMVIGG